MSGLKTSRGILHGADPDKEDDAPAFEGFNPDTDLPPDAEVRGQRCIQLQWGHCRLAGLGRAPQRWAGR